MSTNATHQSELRVEDARVTRYELPDWARTYGVVAGVTGRQRSFHLRWEEGDPAPHAPDWDAFRAVMGPRFHGLVVSAQEHGTAIATHHTSFQGLRVETGRDGHITGARGLLVTVTLADCIPVYLLHPPSGWIALLHAGWRGTAAGVLEAGVQQLCRLGSASPKDLVMHCGVGICGVCYEVGVEVFEAVRATGRDNHRLLDLRENLARRGLSLGIGRITVSAWCTAHDCDRFHSNRRFGADAGRMIAYMGRPAA